MEDGEISETEIPIGPIDLGQFDWDDEPLIAAW
jgi:hypothetical protein